VNRPTKRLANFAIAEGADDFEEMRGAGVGQKDASPHGMQVADDSDHSAAAELMSAAGLAPVDLEVVAFRIADASVPRFEIVATALFVEAAVAASVPAENCAAVAAEQTGVLDPHAPG
jgi:hypothetical protein